MSYRKYKEELYKTTNGKCGYCGKEVQYKKCEIDHKTPKAKGGKDELKNLVISCPSCNRYKINRDVEGFRASIENVEKYLLNNSQYRLALRFGLLSFRKKEIVFYFETI